MKWNFFFHFHNDTLVLKIQIHAFYFLKNEDLMFEYLRELQTSMFYTQSMC